MRILFIHCYYQLRGGEDVVFEQEVELLKDVGEIETLKLRNKGSIGGMLQFLSSIWNFKSMRLVEQRIQQFQPDLIHIHNWHFAFGPAIIAVAKKHKIPVVFTLHNYRLICPSGLLMDGDKVFTESIHESFPWTAVRKKVYRKSYLQTFWLAFVVWFHKKKGTWKSVDRYIILTSFAKELFLQSTLALKPEQFVVKPNYVEIGDFVPVGRRQGVFFAGRLSPEKGIQVLLEAFAGTDIPLTIAGDGPLLPLVKEMTDQYTNIKYVGTLNKPNLIAAMAAHGVLAFPSICYEGMPMTILEAFGTGTPVIASNQGAMSSLVQHGYNGFHFEVGNAADLRLKFEQWQSLSTAEKEDYRNHALNSYNLHYTPEKNKAQLIGIYKDLIGR